MNPRYIRVNGGVQSVSIEAIKAVVSKRRIPLSQSQDLEQVRSLSLVRLFVVIFLCFPSVICLFSALFADHVLIEEWSIFRFYIPFVKAN